MDKKIIIFVTAIILILSSADTVFAEDDSINVEAASSLQQIEELQKEQQQNIQFQENARQLRSQAEASGQGTEDRKSVV